MNSLNILISLSFFFFSTISQNFENTAETTLLWTLISNHQNEHFHRYVIENPSVLNARSEDGRGALWWAWEYGNADALAIMAIHNIDLHYSETDQNGLRPKELATNYEDLLKKAENLMEAKRLEKTKIEAMIQKEKEDAASVDPDESYGVFDDVDDDDDDEDDYESTNEKDDENWHDEF